MKKLLIISILLLSGCCPITPTNISVNWPDAPSDLILPVPDLIPMKDRDYSFSHLLENVNENYSQYYQLKEKYEAWQTWYTQQKKIFEETK
jgi:hypothetical protein